MKDKRTAASATAADATVDTAADSIVTEDTAMLDPITAAIDAALPAPESDAITAARVDVDAISTMLDTLPAASTMRAAIVAALNVAQTTLESLIDADAADTARLDAIDAAHAGVLGLPEAYRAAALATVLAQIDAAYTPTPDAADAALPAVGRKPLHPNTVARNAEVAGNADLLAVAPAYISAFAADMPNCLVNRAAGTRYAGVVTLASSGAGVANMAEFRLISTAVRIELSKTLKDGGMSTIDAQWLARLGRVFGQAGSKPNENLNGRFTGGAFLAQYPNGRFKLAYPTTAGVVRVETNTAAWNAFIGVSSGASVAPAAEAPAASGKPTPPDVQANAYGALTATVPCVHCGASNFVTARVCRAATCKRFPRIDAADAAPDANGATA